MIRNVMQNVTLQRFVSFKVSNNDPQYYIQHKILLFMKTCTVRMDWARHTYAANLVHASDIQTKTLLTDQPRIPEQ